MKAIICVSLGDESYSIDMNDVKEVRRLGSYTRVPNVPDFIAGVLNLRGQIISLLDLKHFFGQSKSKLNEETMIAVAQIGGGTVGFIFDRTDGVFYIEDKDIMPPLQTINETMIRFTLGQVKLSGKISSLISLKDIMASGEIRGFKNGQIE